MLKNRKHCRIKTESYKNNKAELTYEITGRNIVEDIIKMRDQEGIISIDIIDLD